MVRFLESPNRIFGEVLVLEATDMSALTTFDAETVGQALDQPGAVTLDMAMAVWQDANMPEVNLKEWSARGVAGRHLAQHGLGNVVVANLKKLREIDTTVERLLEMANDDALPPENQLAALKSVSDTVRTYATLQDIALRAIEAASVSTTANARKSVAPSINVNIGHAMPASLGVPLEEDATDV